LPHAPSQANQSTVASTCRRRLTLSYGWLERFSENISAEQTRWSPQTVVPGDLLTVLLVFRAIALVISRFTIGTTERMRAVKHQQATDHHIGLPPACDTLKSLCRCCNYRRVQFSNGHYRSLFTVCSAALSSSATTTISIIISSSSSSSVLNQACTTLFSQFHTLTHTTFILINLLNFSTISKSWDTLFCIAASRPKI